MPWYPKARIVDVRRDRGFKNRGKARPITPVRINHHTAVVDRDDLDAQAAALSQPYPHFMIGQRGHITQYQDTAFMARADLDGNPSTISIESWDGYKAGAPGYWRHGADVPPWTDEQVEALIELDAWILETHPSIPLQLATDSRPGKTSHGLSWHRLGVDGNFPDKWPLLGRRPGGIRYSRARGKRCPGDRRIRQIVDVIYPALTTERIDMQDLRAIIRDELERHAAQRPTGPEGSREHRLRYHDRDSQLLYAAIAGLELPIVRATLDALTEAVAGRALDEQAIAEHVALLIEPSLAETLERIATEQPNLTSAQYAHAVANELATRLKEK